MLCGNLIFFVATSVISALTLTLGQGMDVDSVMSTVKLHCYTVVFF